MKRIPQLRRGEAIVLTGPRGSGKTRLARQIALGSSCHEMTAEQFSFVAERDLALSSKADVLIIDGIPDSQNSMMALKDLIASDVVYVQEKGGLSRVPIRSPNVILCAEPGSLLPATFSNNRRFRIVQVAK